MNNKLVPVIYVVVIAIILGAVLFWKLPGEPTASPTPTESANPTPSVSPLPTSWPITDKDGIIWYADTRKINDDLKLFKDPNIQATYYLLGNDHGSDIVAADVAEVYSQWLFFIKKNGTYALLSGYSDQGSYPINASVAPDIRYASLEFPETVEYRGVKLTKSTYFIGSFSLSSEQERNQADRPVKIADTEFGTLSVARQDINGITQIAYDLMLPSGLHGPYNYHPAFLTDDQVPHITWSDGTINTDGFSDAMYTETVEMLTIPDAKLLKVAGTTSTNESVYQFIDPRNPLILSILAEMHDPMTGAAISPEQYDAKHGLIIYHDPLDRWVILKNKFFVPPAERAKPVIYLYPEKPQTVRVNVYPAGGFKKTDPEYGSGWVVQASPTGVITNMSDGQTYPYLFWESTEDGTVQTPKDGFVVAKKDIPLFLESTLSQFGLNEHERVDFKEFWQPKLSIAPYYFITFISTAEIDRTAPMSISPAPDTIIRVLMDYQPLASPMKVKPLAIPSVEREGFTVVEWGGLLRH